MTVATELLIDGFNRIDQEVNQLLDDLPEEALTWRPESDANTIAWLVWHLTRVQDDHFADAFDEDQVWLTDGFVDQFGLPFDKTETGYGMSSDDVAEVSGMSARDLGKYYTAVHKRTMKCLDSVTDKDLERVVDARWDPPVTLAVRLVSVLSDDLQHIGQAAYVRGLTNDARV